MKILNRKFLVAGLLAGALTFVGCKSDKSAERTGETTGTGTTEGTGTTGTGTTEGTTTTPPPAEGTTTGTPPGTGGAGTKNQSECPPGEISKTKQSDDNLRMPEDDPMRTRQSESIRDAESEPGVHDEGTVPPGTGGSGRDDMDNNLNEGGNVDDDYRIPDSPADQVPDSNTSGGATHESQIPDGAR